MSIFLSARLQPLQSGGKDTHLSFSSQNLTILEIVQVVFIFVFRQLLHLIGFGGKLQAATSKDGESFVIPELHLSMPFRLTRDGLNEYASAVGLDDVDSIFSNSVQSCLLLSAFSEPAMLLLLASRGCPVRPLGSVNVRNRFEILVPNLCTKEALLNLKDAEIRAKVLSETRKVKRGLEIDLEVQIVHASEDAVVFRQVFTMLQFMKAKHMPSRPLNNVAGNSIESDWIRAQIASFRIAVEAPLAWAQICKDYNLLHISTIAAKLSGFPGRIAHGNHALALGIASLKHESRCSKEPYGRQDGLVVMEVQFRRPVALPAELSAQMLVSGGGAEFRIVKGDKACVTAAVKV